MKLSIVKGSINIDLLLKNICTCVMFLAFLVCVIFFNNEVNFNYQYKLSKAAIPSCLITILCD